MGISLSHVFVQTGFRNGSCLPPASVDTSIFRANLLFSKLFLFVLKWFAFSFPKVSVKSNEAKHSSLEGAKRVETTDAKANSCPPNLKTHRPELNGVTDSDGFLKTNSEQEPRPKASNGANNMSNAETLEINERIITEDKNGQDSGKENETFDDDKKDNDGRKVS